MELQFKDTILPHPPWYTNYCSPNTMDRNNFPEPTLILINIMNVDHINANPSYNF